MSKKTFTVLGIILLLAIVFYYIADYLALGKPLQTSSLSRNQSDTDTSANNTAELGDMSYKLETVAEGLKVPWAVVFTAPDRMLVTERPGTIREVRSGIVNPQPHLTLPVVAQGESGLMGLVLDPNYETNKRMYACYTYQNGSSLANRVISIIDRDTTLEVEKTIIENAPSARFHAGCELGIGPDEKLYITFGDATEKSLAQDMNSLAGKILRLNLDGSIPSDNPFSGSAIWSLGHRNPQGITWNPVNERMYSAEHGPSGNDGPLGGDEINAIQKGANYGWPTVSHQRSEPGLEEPMLVFTPAVAPASILLYTGDIYPELRNTLLFATLKGEGLYRAVVNQNNPAEVVEFQKLPLPDLGRIREVTQGPDDYIYITTSNTDGRGSPNEGDDKILKLTINN